MIANLLAKRTRTSLLNVDAASKWSKMWGRQTGYGILTLWTVSILSLLDQISRLQLAELKQHAACGWNVIIAST